MQSLIILHHNKNLYCRALALLCISSLYGAAQEFPQTLHREGRLTDPVKQICALLDRPEIQTLEGFNSFAQANLFRRADSRLRKQEHPLLPKMETHKDELIRLFATLGFIESIEPAQKDYEHALVLSDHKFNIIKRLDHLKQLLQKGYHFKKIVLLAAELEIEPEEKDELPEGMTKQTDMMLHEFLKFKCFEGIPVMIVSPPMETKADGSVVRPNTDSQFRDFLKKDPTPGPCLVISNNPHVLRQTFVGKRLMDQEKFPASGSGPAVDSTHELVMLHDELARLTYESYLAFKKQKTAEAQKA